jgi:hypothetical protein
VVRETINNDFFGQSLGIFFKAIGGGTVIVAIPEFLHVENCLAKLIRFEAWKSNVTLTARS